MSYPVFSSKEIQGAVLAKKLLAMSRDPEQPPKHDPAIVYSSSRTPWIET
jgi:hypothetical protein